MPLRLARLLDHTRECVVAIRLLRWQVNAQRPDRARAGGWQAADAPRAAAFSAALLPRASTTLPTPWRSETWLEVRSSTTKTTRRTRRSARSTRATLLCSRPMCACHALVPSRSGLSTAAMPATGSRAVQQVDSQGRGEPEEPQRQDQRLGGHQGVGHRPRTACAVGPRV